MQALTELPITLHLHYHPREVGGEGGGRSGEEEGEKEDEGMGKRIGR